jgi:hypothetical protein
MDNNAAVLSLLCDLQRDRINMSADVDRLSAEVARLTDIIDRLTGENVGLRVQLGHTPESESN